MSFLRRNKNVFNEADFSVLDYEQLLKVNGAGGGSGGGGSGPSGGSSSSGSSSSSSGSKTNQGYPSSTDGWGGNGYTSSGSSGGSSSSGSSSSSSGSSGTQNSSNGSKYVENSNAGVAGANPGDKIVKNDGTVVTLTQGDISWAQQHVGGNTSSGSSSGSSSSGSSSSSSGSSGTQSSSSGSSSSGSSGTQSSSSGSSSSGSSGTHGSSNNNSNSGNNGATTSTTTTNNSTLDSIKQSINNNWEKQYNYDTGYRCDNWVEEVINDAGKKSSDYLTAGKANQKTVQEHIDALKTKTEGVDYTKTLPTEDGAYVVFMDNGTINGKAVGEHAALLVVENGQAKMYDNSSGNGGNPVYKKDSEGNVIKNSNGDSVVSYYDQGVGVTNDITGTNNGKQISGWCYNDYYYQKIQ